jgi:hypothetical protein
MTPDCNMELHIEALKLLKEWSTSLVLVQCGALAVIGGIIRNPIDSNNRKWLSISAVCFLLSIISSASVVGAIPYIVEKLPYNINEYNDIYHIRNYLGIPLYVFTTGQHIFAAIGLGAFAVFLYFHTINKSG